MIADMRFALRQLVKSPGSSLVALASRPLVQTCLHIVVSSGLRQTPFKARSLRQACLPVVETDELARTQLQGCGHVQDIQCACAEIRRVSDGQLFRADEDVVPREHCRLQAPVLQVSLHRSPGSGAFLRGQRAGEQQPRDGIAQLGAAKSGKGQRDWMGGQPRMRPAAERILHIQRGKKTGVGVVRHAYQLIAFAGPCGDNGISRQNFVAVKRAQPGRDIRPRHHRFHLGSSILHRRRRQLDGHEHLAIRSQRQQAAQLQHALIVDGSYGGRHSNYKLAPRQPVASAHSVPSIPACPERSPNT